MLVFSLSLGRAIPRAVFPRFFTTRTDRSSAMRKVFYPTKVKQEISTIPLLEVEIVAYLLL